MIQSKMQIANKIQSKFSNISNSIDQPNSSTNQLSINNPRLNSAKEEQSLEQKIFVEFIKVEKKKRAVQRWKKIRDLIFEIVYERKGQKTKKTVLMLKVQF